MYNSVLYIDQTGICGCQRNPFPPTLMDHWYQLSIWLRLDFSYFHSIQDSCWWRKYDPKWLCLQFWSPCPNVWRLFHILPSIVPSRLKSNVEQTPSLSIVICAVWEYNKMLTKSDLNFIFATSCNRSSNLACWDSDVQRNEALPFVETAEEPPRDVWVADVLPWVGFKIGNYLLS